MSFVGRREELATLARLRERARLVTVLGPPGVGKSRLAAEHAERSRDAYTGGVIVCSLADAHEIEGICAALSRAVGVHPDMVASGTDAVRRLGDALAALGPALLVLDNCERAAVHAREAVAAWLRVSTLHVLVTSRERLGLADETLFDLRPLATPRGDDDVDSSPAVELFVDRVRRVRHGFTLLPADRPHVVRLLQELDGLPLAIELAASRMRVLSLEQLTATLPRRFEVLTSDASPGEPRRAALWEEIERSYSLLKPWEKSALAQCCVFRGGFTVEAAEAVIDLGAYPDAPWSVDVLQALCDKSILSVTAGASGEPRFSQYAVVRDLAARKLDEAGGTDAALRRHADYFVGLGRATCRAMTERDGHIARRRMEPELDNLLFVHARALERASDPGAAELALEIACILAAVLGARGPLESLWTRLDRALAAAASAPVALRARALAARVGLEIQLGRADVSLDACAQLEAEVAALPDQEPRARLLGAIGEALTASGDFARGRASLEHARAIHRASGARAQELAVLAALGINCLEAGELHEARLVFLEEALALARGGDQLQEIRIRNSLGVTEIEEGLLDAAQHHFETALALAQAIGERRYEVATTGNLAAVAQERGCLDDARRGYEAALALNATLRSHRATANLHTFLGNCLFESGAPEQARRHYELALLSFQPTEWRSAMARGGLAAARAALDDVTGARALIDAAKQQLERAQQRRVLAALDVWEGHLDLALARRAAEAADRLLEETLTRRARERIVASLCDPRATARATGGPALAVQCTDLRIALRCLGRALEARPEPPPALLAREPLEVAEGGAWFLPPGWEERVRLNRRRAARLVLARLVDERLAAPGSAISATALLEAGWPGEEVAPDAGAARVYSALYSLRQLGLRDLLQSRDDGYLLDPSVPVVISKDTSPAASTGPRPEAR